ncbi:hypothetical protein ZOSMA_290G00060 [Zostera marina]|uniref:Uncharacterized protein n=1 Tax=Zostera marina TaxID=29655 RepID=A0A0K9PCF6_ZOSMR|nr:hypothetical protein ZOSMA_290G00060 [Zostera marina]
MNKWCLVLNMEHPEIIIYYRHG